MIDRPLTPKQMVECAPIPPIDPIRGEGMPKIIRDNADADSMAWAESFSTLADEVWYPLARGEDLMPELLSKIPNPFYVIPPRKGEMLEIFGRNPGVWTIKENIKAIIEELEPGVHSFIPVNLKVRGSEEDFGKYYLLYFGQAINAVVVDATDFAEGRGRTGFEKSSTISAFGDCILDAEKVRGKHLWRGARGILGSSSPFAFTVFCSDELAKRIKAIGAQGWRFQHCKLTASPT